MTSATSSGTLPSFGQVGYEAYGDHPSDAGCHYSTVVERLASHGYKTTPLGPDGGLRVEVPHGEDPGRWTEVSESVLVTLAKGGADAVAMALHLMMGGPRGGKAERLLEEDERREAGSGSSSAKSLGSFKIDVDSSEAEAAMSRLEVRAEGFVAKLERAATLVDKLEHPAGTPLVDTINTTEGLIDPFLMGISEIASATRDLAEASRSLGRVDTEELEDLVDDVTKALHTRVSALAGPPSPDAEA